MTILQGRPYYSREELEKLHTRQLLNILRGAVRCVPYDYGTDEEIAEWEQYRDHVRAILATRPHVPNKAESKAARIARKKSGQKR